MAFINLKDGVTVIIRLKYDEPKTVDKEYEGKAYQQERFSVDQLDSKFNDIPSGDQYGWTLDLNLNVAQMIAGSGSKKDDIYRIRRIKKLTTVEKLIGDHFELVTGDEPKPAEASKSQGQGEEPAKPKEAPTSENLDVLKWSVAVLTMEAVSVQMLKEELLWKPTPEQVTSEFISLARDDKGVLIAKGKSAKDIITKSKEVEKEEEAPKEVSDKKLQSEVLKTVVKAGEHGLGFDSLAYIIGEKVEITEERLIAAINVLTEAGKIVQDDEDEKFREAK